MLLGALRPTVAAGETGPGVVALFAADPAAAKVDETGTTTAPDLAGPLEGMSIGDLKAEAEAGNLYVNVHTTANPPGELRGQLAASPSAPPEGTGLAATESSGPGLAPGVWLLAGLAL
ncbi:MAG: CHRD domain-containing protein, partial [Dehalococcoidia bacterium]